MRQKKINMLNGPLSKNILLFTVPIAFSSMLQQLFNSADTAIVGFFDTSTSLAAVGTNGEIIALIVSLSSGLSVGVNVIIARMIGQGKRENMISIIESVLKLSIIIGMIGLIAGQCFSAPLLRLIKTPSDTIQAAVIYLRVYFIGFPFLILYDFISAIFRAQGNSRYPFIILTLSGIINVCLNLLFVVLFKLSVLGVAAATAISTFISALLMLYKLKKDFPMYSLFKGIFSKEYTTECLKIGIPSAIQGAVFCFANIFVQASVNSFGSTIIAGSSIAMNFEYFSYYVITAFGQAATTFVSQNYYSGQTKRCRKIMWISLISSFLSSLVIIEPLILFRTFFAGFFSTNQAVINSACLRIMCILFFEPLCSFYEIPAGVLKGSGHALYPAIATITGTCCLRILWIYTIFRRHYRLDVLYVVFPISWVLTVVLIVIGFVILRPFRE